MNKIILVLVFGFTCFGLLSTQKAEATKVRFSPSIIFNQSHNVYPVRERRVIYPQMIEHRYIDPCTGHMVIEHVPAPSYEVVEYYRPCPARRVNTAFWMQFSFR